MARGAAYADIDNDGAPDILLTNNGGPAYLFHNVGGSRNNAIRIKTVGTRSNRDGIGAEVHVHSGGRRKLANRPFWLELLLAERTDFDLWLGAGAEARRSRSSGRAASTIRSRTSRPTALTPSRKAAKSWRRGHSGAERQSLRAAVERQRQID